MFFQHCRDAEVPLHGRLHQFIGCLRRPLDVSRCHVRSSCQIWYWQYPELSLKLATVRECTADDSFGCTEPPSMTNCFSNCLVFVVTVGDAAGRFSWSGLRCPSVTIRALGDFFSSSSRRYSKIRRILGMLSLGGLLHVVPFFQHVFYHIGIKSLLLD